MNIPRITYYSRRHFWAWLNIVWNRVDEARIKEVGPDRACAEWLMRNGAFVKWSGEHEFLKDYNALPVEGDGRCIEEVDGTDSTIMHIGFPHFKGCTSIKRIKLHRCGNIENKALQNLEFVKESLQHLQVSSCGNVTDDGVLSLQVLSNLQSLLLFDLPYVKKKEECTHALKTSLPSCDVDFRNREHSKQ